MKTVGSAQDSLRRQPGRTRAAGVAIVALGVALMCRQLGCVAPESDPAPSPLDGFESSQMLRSLGEQVFLHTYREFQQSAVALHDSAAAWSATDPAGADWAPAQVELQASWRGASTHTGVRTRTR